LNGSDVSSALNLREELRARGFRVLPEETAVVPVVIQDEVDLCRLCKALLEDGIYINPVLRPVAAQNLLRISCTAAHTENHVDRLVTTLVAARARRRCATCFLFACLP
jgi:8-amino-7-oxononanoate synthase